MQPVDVQNREDQLLGAAWRRCEAALEGDGSLQLWRRFRDDGRGRYEAQSDWWADADYLMETGFGPTPAAALDALTEALANR